MPSAVRSGGFRRARCLLGAVAAAAVLGACGTPDTSSPPVGAVVEADPVELPVGGHDSVPAPSTTPAPTEPAPPAPSVPAAPEPDSGEVAQVTWVVDGDTVDLADGRRVRLVGIDTPERGECGYVEATETLRALVGGRDVVLVPGARDDTDRYGRLLRYLDVDGRDANLEMIRSGRAIARYDSRDGYGAHPREAAYVAADASTPSANVCEPAAPAPAAAGAGAGTGGADPRFGSCREAKAAGYGPYVSGVDAEYGWYRDGDGDGTVCE